MTMNVRMFSEYELLERFGRKVSAEACRSLQLLREIENTLGELNKLQAGMRALAHHSLGFAETIASGKFTRIIDLEGKVESALDSAKIEVQKVHGSLVRRRELLRADDRVTHEDGLEDAFSEAIATAADLHSAVSVLRLAVGEHDADLAPERELEPLSSPEEVEAFLATL
jgi:hypothetical protein